MPMPSNCRMGATIKDVVFQYYPNKMTEKDLKIDVALSRLSQNVDWPLAFTADSFQNEREAYQNAVTRVRANVMKGKLDRRTCRSWIKASRRSYSEIGKTYSQDKEWLFSKSQSIPWRAEVSDQTLSW